ncbi:hypothetical protein [Intestinimonas timonensis]|uniref:hypothetical protein n=1 Tax=Intestinimonas timonensis TaxID=1689270 RepID=UPI001F5EAE67|nr:hypothetical protein [Intestinimonas timonensis]
MSLTNDGGAVLTMPVQPANTNGGSGFGWGGDWMSFIVLFLIFGLFGGWGGYGGFGGNAGGSGFQGFATRADINDGFALNNLQGGQRDILGAVQSGFHGVDNAVCNLGYQTQMGFNGLGAQLAQCCCDTREAIGQVRYDMAAQACDTRNTIQNTTRDILENNNSNTRAILDFLTQDKISTLTAENQSLKLAASQSNQNAVLMAAMDANKAEILRRTGAECPTPAYVVQPPQPVTFPNFCNGGCGCGNGCGC